MPTTDLGERIALVDSAGVALIDCGAELRQFRIVTLLLVLERGNTGANHILDTVGAASLDLRFGKANDFIRKIDVAHRIFSKPHKTMAEKPTLNNGALARRGLVAR